MQPNEANSVRALIRFFALMSPHAEASTMDAELLAQEITLSGSQYLHAVNPEDSYHSRMWLFQFGAYGTLRLVVWGRGVEDALEVAAWGLAEHAPGYFVDVDVESTALEMFDREYETLDEYEQDQCHNEATVDLTYTESGYLASYEWFVSEIDPAGVRALIEAA